MKKIYKDIGNRNSRKCFFLVSTDLCTGRNRNSRFFYERRKLLRGKYRAL